MYNIISIIGFAVSFLFGVLLKKKPFAGKILQAASILIGVYKAVFYIVSNTQGQLAIPVEISSITYFLMCIVLIFRIQALYGVCSFFGIISAFGFFLFYSIFGFTLADDFTVKEVVIACINHGFLLTSGIYLLYERATDKVDKLKIWITIFAMLSWSLVFYNIGMPGITFIYYVIKPEFLYVFESMSLNVILITAYYAVLVSGFAFLVKAYLRVNAKIHGKTTSKTLSSADNLPAGNNEKTQFHG